MLFAAPILKNLFVLFSLCLIIIFCSFEGLAIENQNPHVPCESLNPFLDDIVEEDHSLSDILVDRLTYLTSQRNNSKYIII